MSSSFPTWDLPWASPSESQPPTEPAGPPPPDDLIRRASLRETLLIHLDLADREYLARVVREAAPSVALELSVETGLEEVRHGMRFLFALVRRYQEGTYSGKDQDLMGSLIYSETFRKARELFAEVVDDETTQFTDEAVFRAPFLATVSPGHRNILVAVGKVLMDAVLANFQARDLIEQWVRWELLAICQTMSFGVAVVAEASTLQDEDGAPEIEEIIDCVRAVLEHLVPRLADLDPAWIYGEGARH